MNLPCEHSRVKQETVRVYPAALRSPEPASHFYLSKQNYLGLIQSFLQRKTVWFEEMVSRLKA